jgi:hypothetical protein
MLLGNSVNVRRYGQTRQVFCVTMVDDCPQQQKQGYQTGLLGSETENQKTLRNASRPIKSLHSPREGAEVS